MLVHCGVGAFSQSAFWSDLLECSVHLEILFGRLVRLETIMVLRAMRTA